MRKNYLFICLLFLSTGIFAQGMNEISGFIVAEDFNITRPLREIVADHPIDPDTIQKKKKKKPEESLDRLHRIPQKFPKTVNDGPEYGNDPKSLQTKMGEEPGRAPIANWAGQTASGFRPFDPSGAPGINYYIQMINSTTFKVYNKSTGAVVLTTTFGNLWSPATPNDGDPIVLYDKAADRWFLAQFGSSGNKIYIAVSTTGDPTGSYYTYTYTSPQFPDYLKFSVWQDGYYMTSNQGTQKVFCFERAAMLIGTPGARAVYTNYSPPDGGGFFCPLPGDASDGTLPPPGTPCPILSYSDNGWGGGFTDAVHIYNMTVNWVPVTPTANITLAATVPTAAFDASYNSSWNDVSQPGTSQKLDGIGGVLTYRAQWRNWSGYNTMVINWGVLISASQRSIKWCELRQNQSTGIWSLYQEGIYTPDSYTRWMGSIAMDVNGSIGLCYTKSGASTVFPSLGYAGRKSCDPLGTFTISETIAISGSSAQSGTNRFGDYSQTVLDPDGVTFWHTAEYMGTGGAAKTQIYSFQLPSCTNTAVVNISQTAGTNPNCTGSTNTFTATPTNGGTTPSYQWKINGTNAGANSTTFTTSSLTNGQIITCVMTSNLPGVTGNPATSNAITMTINPYVAPSVSIAQTLGSNPMCAGASATFTASPVNGGTTPSYQWKVNGANAGTNSSTFTTTSLTNGQVVTCVVTSNGVCVSPATATSNSITMTVNPNVSPTVSIAQTTGTNPLCSGTSATFTATIANGNSPTYQWKVNGTNVGTNSSTFTTSSLTNGQVVSCVTTLTSNCSSLVTNTLGTGTGTNPTTGVSTADLGNAYPTYYGNGRQQYLIRGTELTSLGFTSGNINSIGFTINGTIGDPSTLNGYTIKIATTATSTLTSTFQTPTFSTVFGPVNYTPVLNSLNTHTFSTPYPWTSSSNLLIDICFSNQVLGTVAYQNYQTSSTFVSTTYYQADNAGGAGACTRTTGTTGSMRPNIFLSIGSSAATATSNNITMTVNSSVAPSVSIGLTSGSNPQCSGASATFTATPVNGGGTPSYQWKVNGTNAGTNSSTFTTSTLTNGQTVTCVMNSSLSCASPASATSTGISMTVNPAVTPAVSISQTAGSNPQCSGASATFTATPSNGGTPSYQWKVNGTNVGSNSASYTTTTLTNGQTVTCVMTSTASCASPQTATSGGIIMMVNPTVSPLVSISQTSGTNPLCSGQNIQFTATPTNGGTPSYQWKVNGTNAGSNSPVFSTSSLTNGQVVSCVMTSTANCVSPTTATSGGITMFVNPVVTPSVSIALTTGNNPQCAGAPVTFTATPVNGGTPTYQWKVNGNNEGSNSVTFTTSTLSNGQVISCEITSSANCASPVTASSTGITMGVNPNLSPSVSVGQTGGTNPLCEGSMATFTAAPVNGGSTPSYQWKVNGFNDGTNSSVFATSSLNDNDIISCQLTSSEECLTSNPVPSSAINMTVLFLPAVNSFNPISGNPGDPVIITGSGFSAASAVTFNGLSSSFVIDNDNQITANVPAGSNSGLINVTTTCGNANSAGSFNSAGNVILQLKVFIEGFYTGNEEMVEIVSPGNTDTITVGLASPSSPFNILYTDRKTVNKQGDGVFEFSSAAQGNSYYIVVRHRNSIEIWSKTPVLFNLPVNTFDFTRE